MSDILFRRINGRIVPIKKTINSIEEAKKAIKKTSKSDVPALAQVGAGFGVAGVGGHYGGKMIRRSWDAYRSSAHIRGSIKEILSIKPNIDVTSLYKEAAAFKVAGKALANRGFGLLAVSGVIGSSLAGYGAYKYLKNKNKVNDGKAYSIASGAAALASGAGVALFARKAKIKHIVSALRATGKTSVSDIYGSWSKYGQERTRKTIRKYSDIAASGAKKSEYSHNISKTIKQLKKANLSKNNDGQMSLF